MKNITLSADDRLIEEARARALRENTTLNAQFRRWLESYVGRREQADRAMRTIEELRKVVKLRGPYTRDEMNER
jgi:hypothetical protein